MRLLTILLNIFSGLFMTDLIVDEIVDNPVEHFSGLFMTDLTVDEIVDYPVKHFLRCSHD